MVFNKQGDGFHQAFFPWISDFSLLALLSTYEIPVTILLFKPAYQNPSLSQAVTKILSAPIPQT